MLKIKLMGGLGNQMFQYAFIKSLAKQRGQDNHFFLDTSFLNRKSRNANYTLRDFELGDYQIQGSHGNHLCFQVISLIDRTWKKLLDRVIDQKSQFWFTLKQHLSPIHFEDDVERIDIPPMKFNPRHFQSSKSFYVGYFQSEDYFKNIQRELQKDFTPKGEPKSFLSVESYNFFQKIIQEKGTAISVHIRRGDYVTLQDASAHHGVCSKAYYENALQKMKSQFSKPSFYFFSDDIPWVKNEFSHLEGAHFIENPPGKKSFEDIFLMSLCHGHVVANSSFSWWGAWLSQSQLVIAPKRWYAGVDPQNTDIIPKHWMQLE